MNYEEVREKASQQYEAHKAKKRAGYTYARKLGFNTREARILSTWSKERIDQCARERDHCIQITGKYPVTENGAR